MADLDPKIVRTLLTSELPGSGLPAPRLPTTMRRRRDGCYCCGEITLGGSDREICWGCSRAGCREMTPSNECPMQMTQTQRDIRDSTPSPVDMSVAMGRGRGTERDDDRMSEDRVLLEHFAWRSLRSEVMQSVFGGRAILPPYPQAEPIYIANGSRRRRDPQSPRGLKPQGMALQHQVLTMRGWYYEHIEGYPPLLCYLKREEGLRVYYQASAYMNGSGTNPYFGPYGEDRYSIPVEMQDVIDAMGEKIGLECLADFDIARVFLTPLDDSGLVLLHRVLAMNQQIVDNHIYTNNEGEVPNHELKTLMGLWARLREESTYFENALASHSKITKKQATSGLLIRDNLGTSAELIKQLLLSSC